MLRLAILLCAVAYSLGAAVPEGMLPQMDGRIVGGEITTINSFPWQVSLQRYRFHFCGGAIYSSTYIITAAHCLQDVELSALKVRAGSSYWSRGGTSVSVAEFKNHEGYNSRTNANDIAVIRLKSALPMSSTIKAIPLAATTPVDGAVGVVSGWGKTSSDGKTSGQLRYVDIDIVSRKKCSSSTYGYGYLIKKSMFCAYTVGKDSCQGDSGGPLVSGGVLAGIVSWGKGCAYSNYPGVYSDVAGFRSWIESSVSSA